jgi:hypothetical protein
VWRRWETNVQRRLEPKSIQAKTTYNPHAFAIDQTFRNAQASCGTLSGLVVMKKKEEVGSGRVGFDARERPN